MIRSWPKTLAAGILGLALTVSPAFAQTDDAPRTPPRQEAQDDDFDWGWLGLLGLVGLLGLTRRRENRTDYREQPRTGTR